jgi:hypothetical protein
MGPEVVNAVDRVGEAEWWFAYRRARQVSRHQTVTRVGVALAKRYSNEFNIAHGDDA